MNEHLTAEDLYDYNAFFGHVGKYPMDDEAGFAEAERTAFAAWKSKNPYGYASHEEAKALDARINAHLAPIRAIWQAELDATEARYWALAFAEQGDLHPRIIGCLHGRAYERSHSSGITDVYQSFVDECRNYRELKAIEKELGL